MKIRSVVFGGRQGGLSLDQYHHPPPRHNASVVGDATRSEEEETETEGVERRRGHGEAEEKKELEDHQRPTGTAGCLLTEPGRPLSSASGRAKWANILGFCSKKRPPRLARRHLSFRPDKQDVRFLPTPIAPGAEEPAGKARR